jgi:hypothetical protein
MERKKARDALRVQRKLEELKLIAKHQLSAVAYDLDKTSDIKFHLHYEPRSGNVHLCILVSALFGSIN